MVPTEADKETPNPGTMYTFCFSIQETQSSTLRSLTSSRRPRALATSNRSFAFLRCLNCSGSKKYNASTLIHFDFKTPKHKHDSFMRTNFVYSYGRMKQKTLVEVRTRRQRDPTDVSSRACGRGKKKMISNLFRFSLHIGIITSMTSFNDVDGQQAVDALSACRNDTRSILRRNFRRLKFFCFSIFSKTQSSHILNSIM